MTVSELARSINQTHRFTRELLADWQDAGIAEETDGRWRLTEFGFRSYGAGLLVIDTQPKRST